MVRISPGEEATAVTAAQLRAMIGELTRTGQHQPGDPEMLVVLDAGYEVIRLGWLLDDLPVTFFGRLRSDRVFYARSGARRGST